MKLRLEGIWCPMITPLAKDASIDVLRTRALVDFLIDGGVDGLFPLGTSGEFALLSDSERKIVMETVVDHVNGRLPVAVGVSDPSFEKVVGYSKEAKNAGADAVVATPPYFYTLTDEAIYRFYKNLAREIELPLLIYNIPEWTHNFVTPEVVGRLAEEKLVVGIKYTEYNFLNLLKFHEAAKGRIAIFTGSDALTFANLAFGGSGAVIGISNVAPRKSSDIYDEFRRGNLRRSRQAQLEILPLIEAIGTGKFPAGLKESMKLVGMPVGTVKPPLLPLSAPERRHVKELVRKSGLLEKKQS